MGLPIKHRSVGTNRGARRNQIVSRRHERPMRRAEGPVGLIRSVALLLSRYHTTLECFGIQASPYS